MLLKIYSVQKGQSQQARGIKKHNAIFLKRRKYKKENLHTEQTER